MQSKGLSRVFSTPQFKRLRAGSLSVAKRSYPTSELRGRNGRTPCPKGGGQEELPHVRGQGQRPRVPGCDGAGRAERRYPASEVRGGGQEEQRHVQGAVAVRAQEGLEELSHVEGQEGGW